MTSAFENVCGPGKPLKAEPPDAKEYAGLTRSGMARLKDASVTGSALRVASILHITRRMRFVWPRYVGTAIDPANATSCSSCCRVRWVWGLRYGAYYRSATTSATSENPKVT